MNWSSFDTDLVDRIFHDGLLQDAAGRKSLLEPFLDVNPELCTFIEDLWMNHDAGDAFPDSSEIHAFALRALEQERNQNLSFGKFVFEKLLSDQPMGIVFRAFDKVHERPVAVKIFQGFGDLQKAMWRFDKEITSLASMESDRIAKLFESGITPYGKPYFAMEFLDGEPITTFCDRNKLSIEERLRLFIKVCEGVQDAHQKMVVHRDLKPENILVVWNGKEPVPKLIDFGIAKSYQANSNNQTEVIAIMGTRAYMSPEVADGNASLVDSRTDIYGLGILLCELLAGVVPDAEDLKIVTNPEWCRIVSNREFVLLSRLLPVGEEETRIADTRQMAPKELKRYLSKELTLIVQHATWRHPQMRYKSSDALARDIENFLKNLPLSVSSSSRFYRTYKFMARNKKGIGIAGAVLLAFFIAFLSVSWSLSRTKKSERRLEAVNQFNHRVFNQVHPNRLGPKVLAADLLEDAETAIQASYGENPDLELPVRLTLGQSYQGLNLHSDALRQYERALEIATSQKSNKYLLSAMEGIAFSQEASQQFSGAKANYVNGFELAKRMLGPGDPQTLRFAAGLANTLSELGERTRAKTLFQETLEAQEAALRPGDVALLATRINFAKFLIQAGENSYARELLEKNMTETILLRNPNHPLLLNSKHFLARVLAGQGETGSAMDLYQSLLQSKQQYLGFYNDDSLATFNDLILLLNKQKRFDLTLQKMDDLFRSWPKEKPVNSQIALTLKHNYGESLLVAGQFAQSEQVLREVLEEKITFYNRENRSTLITEWTIGETLEKLDKAPEAEAVYRAVVEKSPRLLGEEELYTHLFRGLFGKFLMANNGQKEGRILLNRCLPYLKEKNSPYAQEFEKLLVEK